jgi:hypothetical protein
MWMDAGIAVQAGDQIVFTASGTYWLGPGPSWTPSTINCPPGTPDPRGAAPNIPSSSIVGRVGASGTAFCIGAGATIVAGSSSELYLTINDWVGYYSDNSGGVTVNWQISHQP